MKYITYHHYGLEHLQLPKWGKCSWSAGSLSFYQQLSNLQKYFLTTSRRITDHSHVCLVITWKLNKSSLWSGNEGFWRFYWVFGHRFYIEKHRFKTYYIPTRIILETLGLLLGWIYIWFNHSNSTALVRLRISQENKEYCRYFHL